MPFRILFKLFGLSALAARFGRRRGVETIEVDDTPLPLDVQMELALMTITAFVEVGASDRSLATMRMLQRNATFAMYEQAKTRRERAAVDLFALAIDFCLRDVTVEEFSRGVQVHTQTSRPLLPQVGRLIELFPFLREKIPISVSC